MVGWLLFVWESASVVRAERSPFTTPTPPTRQTCLQCIMFSAIRRMSRKGSDGRRVGGFVCCLFRVDVVMYDFRHCRGCKFTACTTHCCCVCETQEKLADAQQRIRSLFKRFWCVYVSVCMCVECLRNILSITSFPECASAIRYAMLRCSRASTRTRDSFN